MSENSTNWLNASAELGRNRRVSVIVPALNEEAHIVGCVRSLLDQVDCDIVEVIVADGGSTDRTASRVLALAEGEPRLRLITNPGRIQSIGFNLAAAQSNPLAHVFIRADAHASYLPDFVARCVQSLRSSGATSVVVPMQTVGEVGFQRAVAEAQNSRIGNGGSAHRGASAQDGPIDHGHHAAFDRDFFLRCGGYDQTFTHNEDAEFDYRARQAGGLIWMCSGARVDYFPRSTIHALSKQYARHGSGRCRTLIKHRLRPRLRQLVPVLLLPGLIACFLLSVLWPVFLAVPAVYAATCLGYGVAAAIRRRDPWLLATGVAAMTMHLSFAAGFPRELIGERLSRNATDADRYGVSSPG